MTALLAFELRRRLRDGRLVTAWVLVAAGAMALAWGLHQGHLLPADARRLYGYLHFAALALVFRFDLAQDLDGGFADLVAPSLLPVGTFLGVRLAAGLAALPQFLGPAAALAALAPGLDARFAVWHACLWMLLSLAAAPAVLLAELWLRTRLPVLPVGMLGAAAVLVAAGSGTLPTLSAATGTSSLSPGAFTSLSGLAMRGALSAVVGLWAGGLLAARHWAPR